jgi:exopolysaccharide production protein ExoZ
MDNKILSVQYLRGLAALLVVAAHAGAHPLTTEFYLYGRIGQLGVTLFFVISGFIMVAITGTGPLKPLDFLRRRAIRIVPLYWIFTGLAAVLAVLAPSMFHSTTFTWPHFLQSLAFIPHLAPGRTDSTSPLLSLGWTLNFEAMFYVAFALFGLFVARTRVAILSVAFLALTLYGLFARPTDPALSFYTDSMILAFVVGCWLGLGWLNGTFGRLPRMMLPALGAIGVIAAIIGFVYDQSVASPVSFLSVLALATTLVAGGLMLDRKLRPMPLLEKLGDASYAIYLIHMFVVGALVAVTRRFADPTEPLVGIAIIVAAVLLSSVAGLLVHRYVEKPLLKLLRGRRRVAPQPATPEGLATRA